MEWVVTGLVSMGVIPYQLAFTSGLICYLVAFQSSIRPLTDLGQFSICWLVMKGPGLFFISTDVASVTNCCEPKTNLLLAAQGAVSSFQPPQGKKEILGEQSKS